jgi:hypothetical protein
MTWCEWEYYQNFGDKTRLSEVFIPLMAYHRWMREHHTWPDGTYFSTGWGCGMDNIRRVDKGYHTMYSHGHSVWVDACMQELLNCNILIEMARIVGREEFIPELTDERDMLRRVINEKLWDEKSEFYYDLWRGNKFSGIKHIGAYWGLLAKCADKERAEKLIAHLENVKVAATFIMVDRKEKGQGEKGAMQEIEEQFGFPVYSVVDVYDIIEYLEEDPANAENVERIKNYLVVNGAK